MKNGEELRNLVSWQEARLIINDHTDSLIIYVTPSVPTGDPVSVRTLWVLGLCLKSIFGCIYGRTGHKSSTSSLFSPEFIQCVVFLATQDTGFKSEWLLNDLEVTFFSNPLSIYIYLVYCIALHYLELMPIKYKHMNQSIVQALIKFITTWQRQYFCLISLCSFCP